MTFGERLIDLRKTRKYTREALAEELNISKYTLRNYELSVNEPGSSFLKQVSDFFDVSIDYLMGMTNEKEKILHGYINRMDHFINLYASYGFSHHIGYGT